MWKPSIFTLVLISTLPVFAQNSVTVTATRPNTVQPDLIVLGVDVLSAPDATRDDVLAALQGSVITAANFPACERCNSLARPAPSPRPL